MFIALGVNEIVLVHYAGDIAHHALLCGYKGITSHHSFHINLLAHIIKKPGSVPCELL